MALLPARRICPSSADLQARLAHRSSTPGPGKTIHANRSAIWLFISTDTVISKACRLGLFLQYPTFRIVDRGCGGSADQRRSGLSRQVARSRSGGFHTALSYQYRYQRACRCGHHRDRLLAARCRIRTLAGLSNHARTAGQAPPKGRLRALPPGIARQRGVRRRDDAPGMSRDRSQGIPAPTPKMRFWNGHATPVRPARMSDRGSFPDAASGGIPCELFAGHFRVQSTRSVDKFRFCRNVSKVSRLLESRSPEMTLPASCCRLFSTVVNDRHFDSAVRCP